jgi:porin
MQATTVNRLRSAAVCGTFLAASSILASPGTANAQAQPAAAPPPPPPGYMFDLSPVGKSFGETLKAYGIYLNGGAETNVYGWIAGGRKTGVNLQGEDTLGVDLDLNRMFGIPAAAIHVSTDDRWGQNPGRFSSGTLTTANYGPQDNYRLGELSYDQDLFNDHVRILVGRIADNIDFNTSELYCRFLFAICGNGSSMWYLNNANPSYPVATWGGRVTIKPSLESYLRFGAYQETSVAGANAAFGKSFDFGHNTGVFLPAEIGYKTSFAQDPFPRGAYIGGWYDSSRFTDVLRGTTPGTVGGYPERGRSGIYFQMQQMVYRPSMQSERGLTVFGVAQLETSDTGPFSQSYTGGLSWVGPLFTRPEDKLNFGFINYQFNRKFVEAWRDSCFNSPSTGPGAFFPGLTGFARRNACSPFSPTEWQVELNYSYKLAPGIDFIPVVAYFINPDMGTTFPGTAIPPTFTHPKNAWVVGAQLAIGLNGAFGLPAFVRTN